VCLLLAAACRQSAAPPPPPRPGPALDLAQVQQAFPPGLVDGQGWARDLLTAFSRAGVTADATRVCGAVAILRQESGFQADPPVANLGMLVRKRLTEEAERYGPLGPRALKELLAERAPDDRRTFDERVRRLRTERELDLLFRDMLEAERRRHPAMVATANLLDTLIRGRKLDDLNPVTTAGSMQVSVRWALAHAKELGMPTDELEVRDALYTRAGGLRFGVARLWTYPAAYRNRCGSSLPCWGVAPRNAAIQRALAKLTGVPVAADGDLVAFGPDGQPRPEDSDTLKAFRLFRDKFAPTLSDAQLRRDVQAGKGPELEQSPTLAALRRAYREQTGQPLPAAAMPELELKSPKIRHGYTTAAYAKSVDGHSRACLQRLKLDSAQGQAPREGSAKTNACRVERSGDGVRDPEPGTSPGQPWTGPQEPAGERSVGAPPAPREPSVSPPGATLRAGRWTRGTRLDPGCGAAPGVRLGGRPEPAAKGGWRNGSSSAAQCRPCRPCG
jgi:hypothetical protein